MGLPHLNKISPERRAEMLELARIAREAKKEAGKSLRQDWADAKLWEWLRAKTKVKAPLYYIPCSETKTCLSHSEEDWERQCLVERTFCFKCASVV